MDTEARLSQFPKAHGPISFTPSGIVSDFSPLNPQKEFPTISTPSGTSKSVKSSPLKYKWDA